MLLQQRANGEKSDAERGGLQRRHRQFSPRWKNRNLCQVEALRYNKHAAHRSSATCCHYHQCQTNYNAERERGKKRDWEAPRGIHLAKLHNHGTFAEVLLQVFCAATERRLCNSHGDSLIEFTSYIWFLIHRGALSSRGSLHWDPVAPAACSNGFQAFVQFIPKIVTELLHAEEKKCRF